MAVKGSGIITLGDWARRVDPGGKIDKIVEILDDVNEVLGDMPFMESNLPTGHKTTIRSGLPTVTWRRLNFGVQPSSSRTVQVTESIGMLACMSETDKELVDLNGETAAFLLSETKPKLEALAQEMASTLFYGNTESDPEKFMGLAPRYDSLSAENATNIIVGGGSGSDNSSVWLVGWGNDSVHGIFPKGSKAGIWSKNEADIMLEDSSNGKYPGYRSYYQQKSGLVLKDWRSVVRVANIDNSDLLKDAATGADLIELMIRAIHKIPSQYRKNMKFYVNEKIETFLDLQTLNQSNINIKYGDDEHGKMVMKFRGIPIRRCDALLETEATIS